MSSVTSALLTWELICGQGCEPLTPLSLTLLILKLGPILWFHPPLTIQFSGCSPLPFFPFSSFSSKLNCYYNYITPPSNPTYSQKIFFLLRRGQNAGTKAPESQPYKLSINPRKCRVVLLLSVLQRSLKELPWRN